MGTVPLSKHRFRYPPGLKHGVLENPAFIRFISDLSIAFSPVPRGFTSQPCLMTLEGLIVQRSSGCMMFKEKLSEFLSLGRVGAGSGHGIPWGITIATCMYIPICNIKL